MTSRSQAAVSSARRAELFAQAGAEEKETDMSAKKPASSSSAQQTHAQEQLQQQEPGAEEDESPLQLEHILGFAGEFRGNCVLIPGKDNFYVKGVGSLVCIESLLDAHDQKLLRGHDMPVCVLAVSPSGALVASGQLGTVKFKGKAAPIFIWDAHTRKRLLVLRGLTIKVNIMAFSIDERYLCACGEVRLTLA